MTDEKNLSLKLIIRVIVFLLIAAFLLIPLGILYIPYDSEETRQSRSFYEADRDSVDVLIVASSTVRNGLSPNEFWHNYGISAYTRGDSKQAPEIALFDLEEALKYQKPKLVILGITQLFSGYPYAKEEPFIRKSLDYKKFSMLKMQTVAEIKKMDHDESLLSFAFPVLRYHSRWNEITYEDYLEANYPDHDFMRGQHRVKEIRTFPDRKFYDPEEKPKDYDEHAWEEYLKIADCAKKNGIDLLIVTMPGTTFTYGNHLTASRLCEEAGIDYFDFNLDEVMEESGIDYRKDFYDHHHLNLMGARKATKYLGKYILEKYDIPQWQVSDEVKKRLDSDYTDYMKEYRKYYKHHYLKEDFKNAGE